MAYLDAPTRPSLALDRPNPPGAEETPIINSRLRLASPGLSGLPLQPPAVARHRKAEREIDHRHEHIDLDAELLPDRIDDRGLRRGQQIENADDEHEAGVLEEGDEGVHQRRDDVADRLRQ